MNHSRLSDYGKVTKPNGQIFPSLKRFFNESRCIPYPEIALPWMEKEQKFTYASNDITFQYYANRYQQGITRSREVYYQNRLFEVVVGAILREYLVKNDPKATFYYASKYDDLFSAFDYMVCNGNESVRIDLTMTKGRIGSVEEDYMSSILRKKINRFHGRPGIPEEFFRSVKPHESPKSLPLIIIQLNYSVLSAFANDFFKTMATSKKTKMDILEHFSSWIDDNMNVPQNDIACIIGMTKNLAESSLHGDQTVRLTKQIGALFTGMSGVSITTTQ